MRNKHVALALLIPLLGSALAVTTLVNKPEIKASLTSSAAQQAENVPLGRMTLYWQGLTFNNPSWTALPVGSQLDEHDFDGDGRQELVMELSKGDDPLGDATRETHVMALVNGKLRELPVPQIADVQKLIRVKPGQLLLNGQNVLQDLSPEEGKMTPRLMNSFSSEYGFDAMPKNQLNLAYAVVVGQHTVGFIDLVLEFQGSVANGKFVTKSLAFRPFRGDVG